MKKQSEINGWNLKRQKEGEEGIFQFEEACSYHLAQLSEEFRADKKLNRVAMGIVKIPV